MQKSLELVRRCSVELCAALCSDGDNMLVENSMKFIKQNNIEGIPLGEIEFEVEHNLGARLYCKHKREPEKVKNTNLLQELLRKLWMYQLIAETYESITLVELQKAIAVKYEEEKSFNPELSPKKFHLFELVDTKIKTESIIFETGKILQNVRKCFSDVYKEYAATFSLLQDYSYMNDIYNEKNAKAMASKIKPKIATPIKDEKKEEKRIEPTTNDEQLTKLKDAAKAMESSLRDQIRVLEGDKHDLSLKLSYAKKDAIREFIYALTGYGWNCPLSELYLLLKDDSTPEKIKGVINNLFMALGSENIKLVKEKLVGEKIVLDEENQKQFDPYKNEELFLSDEVTVYYPGYRYDRDIMVRPTVRKKQTIQEDKE